MKPIIVQNAIRMPDGQIYMSRFYKDRHEVDGVWISGGHSAFYTNAHKLHEAGRMSEYVVQPHDDYRLDSNMSQEVLKAKILLESFDEDSDGKHFYYKLASESSHHQIQRYIKYLNKNLTNSIGGKHTWFIPILETKIHILNLLINEN